MRSVFVTNVIIYEIKLFKCLFTFKYHLDQKYFLTKSYSLKITYLFKTFLFSIPHTAFFQIGPGYIVVKTNLGYVVVTETSVEPLMTRMVYHVYVHSPLIVLVSRMILNGILITVCSKKNMCRIL